jgi:hypothetical protein
MKHYSVLRIKDYVTDEDDPVQFKKPFYGYCLAIQSAGWSSIADASPACRRPSHAMSGNSRLVTEHSLPGLRGSTVGTSTKTRMPP